MPDGVLEQTLQPEHQVDESEQREPPVAPSRLAPVLVDGDDPASIARRFLELGLERDDDAWRELHAFLGNHVGAAVARLLGRRPPVPSRVGRKRLPAPPFRPILRDRPRHPGPVAPIAPVEEELLEEIPVDDRALTPVDGALGPPLKDKPVEEELLAEIPVDDLAPMALKDELVKQQQLPTNAPDQQEQRRALKKALKQEDVTNQVAQDRIKRGVEAVTDLKERVVGKAPTVEPAPAPLTEPKTAPSSRGPFAWLIDLFHSRSEDDELPLPPAVVAEVAPEIAPVVTEPAPATRAGPPLTELASKLDAHLPALAQPTPKVSQEILPLAKQEVDTTATQIQPDVKPAHYLQLGDIGVGIAAGFEAMAQTAIARGGIDKDALTIGKSLTGQTATAAMVNNAQYLKMAPMAYKQQRKDVGDIESEARLMREFDHPNVLSSAGPAGHSEDELPGYAMPVVPLGALDSVFKRMLTKKDGATKLTVDERVLVMRYLMRGGFRGLEHVHGQGYVHGDIKQQNFLLDQDPDQHIEPLLMDFGLTGKAGEGLKGLGTESHVAPEVVEHQSSGKLAQSSDIWSMGETILLGVFGQDSVDLDESDRTGQDVKLLDRGKSSKRMKMGEARWRTVLDARMQQLQGNAEFKDFMANVMRWRPEQRMTAIECLQHTFLQLTDHDEGEAERLLKQLVPARLT